ncbi:MAG: hypothetical protein GXP02_07975, partial [Alphaproteobacteria bacterium]|nr:hypothetical protein [Alphaproteobacteria bacterium]
MSFSLKTTVMAAVLSCLLAIISPAYAKISPDIRALLTMAAQKDGGTNLDMVAAVAIPADPANDKEIQQFVTGLKQQFATSPKQQKSKQQ